jgi:penicillin-binding protein 2
MKFGKAFSDNLSVTQKTATRMPRDQVVSWWLGAGRALIFATILFVAFFVLLWRLFDLTVIRGHELRALADTNRTRELIIHAPRGLLLDRTGKPLVTNIPENRRVGNFTETDYRRQYLYPDSVSQITGYTGELTDEELHDEYYQLREYQAGDKIGRVGAEAYFEDKLRGRDGRELVEVDATGKILRVLGRREAVGGEDVTLSVDASLAETAARAFPAGEKGAIVVSKPSTGEILALYSAPAFSANRFAMGMSTDEYTALLNNPDRPLFNRAIGGTYPPGSTFKIVLAVAGMEEGYVKPDTIVEDNGTITIGPFTFPNWYFLQYGKTEGPVDIVKALQRSNDIFFYKVGEWLGITKIAKWSRIMGLGKLLGIELSGEATGLVPDPTWKESALSDKWYLGDTYHVAIGQGYLLTTPLQANVWTNSIASGGELCKPTIEKMKNEKLKMQNCKDLGIKKETISLVTKGMQEACATGGTGWPLFDFKIKEKSIPVACKTGTAEFGDPKNRTHAWFTAFAPAADPELSITVLVEGAGEGSNVAAPIAKKILEEWFGR